MACLTARRFTWRMTVRTVTLFAAALVSGLSAGLFYSYACSVMPGLGRSSDRTFVEGMQGINVAIINPVFMVTFLGTAVLTGLAVLLYLPASVRGVLPWIIAGLVLYLATLVITFAVNIPLNNQLMAAGEPDRIADLAAVRLKFETTWVRWNIVRALTSTAAFACLAWALLAQSRSTAS